MAESVVEKLIVGPFSTNCYLISWQKEAFLIDPAFEWKRIENYAREKGLNLRFIINTHGHIDHIADEDKLGLEVFIHKEEEEYLKSPELNLSDFLLAPQTVSLQEVNLVKGGEKFKFGPNFLQIIHTPGHSPGGISIVYGDYLFTGDTLFYSSVGRTDIPGADYALLQKSVEKLLALSSKLRVFPGHGPETTIARERESMFFSD